MMVLMMVFETMAKRTPALPFRLHEQLVKLLSQQSGITRAILFGSRARGDAEERSDIDISVEAPDVPDRQWLEFIFLLEEIDTLLPIDVVRWENAPDTLKRKIQTEGIVLYERPKGGPKPS
jgi:predicted nucleotidyltransferase